MANTRIIIRDDANVVTKHKLDKKCSEYALRKKIVALIGRNLRQFANLKHKYKKSGFVIAIIGYTVTKDENEPIKLLIAISGSVGKSQEEHTGKKPNYMKAFANSLAEGNILASLFPRGKVNNTIGEIQLVTSVNLQPEGTAHFYNYGTDIKPFVDPGTGKISLKAWKCTEPKLLIEVLKLQQQYPDFKAMGENYFQIQNEGGFLLPRDLLDVSSCPTCKKEFMNFNHLDDSLLLKIPIRKLSDPHSDTIYSNPTLYRGRGKAMLDAKNFSTAIQYFQEAISLEQDPANSDQDKINLAYCYNQEGQKTENLQIAIKNYSDAIACLESLEDKSQLKSATLALYHASRAFCYARLEQKNQGAADLEKAIALDFQVFSYFTDLPQQDKITLADWYYQKGEREKDIKEAIGNYSQAINYLEPLRGSNQFDSHTLAIYYANRALRWHTKGASQNEGNAFQDFQQAMELDPYIWSHFVLNDEEKIHVAMMCDHLGKMASKSGNYDAAIENYSLAILQVEALSDISNKTNSASYYIKRALCYAKLTPKQNSLAFEDCQHAIWLDPNIFRADSRLKKFYYEHKKIIEFNACQLDENISKKVADIRFLSRQYAELALLSSSNPDYLKFSFDNFQFAIQKDSTIWSAPQYNDPFSRMKIANWYCQLGLNAEDNF
jgi:tetratricopeptide (TPR) repeat protein